MSTKAQPQAKLLRSAFGLALSALLSLSCQNGAFRAFKASVTSNKDKGTSTPQVKASSVKIFDGGDSFSPKPYLRVFLDTAASSSFTDLCLGKGTGTGGASRDCSCVFKWNEINLSNGDTGPIAVPRKVVTPVTLVQSGMLECPVPAAYQPSPDQQGPQEIQDNTEIFLTVIPVGSNTNQFSFTAFKFTRAGNAKNDNGAFEDEYGNQFDNILRYSCYEQFHRGLQIVNRRVRLTEGGAGSAAFANNFCFYTAEGKPNQGCDKVENKVALSTDTFSSQSYYYSLFVKNTEKGNINLSNARYRCPTVDKPLDTLGFWPMDSSFALAMSPHDDFVLPVEGYNKLGTRDEDASAQKSTCYPKQGGDGVGGEGSNEGQILQGCLGFASKAKADGTCPRIVKSETESIPTYRLRKYYALYPNQYDTNGKLIDKNSPAFDVVFVVDRPVLRTNANGQTEEFTMLGPKPCPIAYFDHSGVTGLRGAYVGTPDTRWNGKNVDGLQYPYYDFSNPPDLQSLSCAAAIPLLSPDKKVFSIGTVSPLNPYPPMKKLYIRPQDSWSPEYVEDTDFQACAPLSQPFRDPPLHFTKQADGNVAYCAETYPSGNPFINRDGTKSVLDSGKERSNTTAHTSKASRSACKDSDCTRVAKGDDANTEWIRFPLLAPEESVEQSLYNSPSYTCRVTWDNKGVRSKQGRSPASGCCDPDAVDVHTDGISAREAHLDTGFACGKPRY